jgi:hypothetical protein
MSIRLQQQQHVSVSVSSSDVEASSSVKGSMVGAYDAEGPVRPTGKRVPTGHGGVDFSKVTTSGFHSLCGWLSSHHDHGLQLMDL